MENVTSNRVKNMTVLDGFNGFMFKISYKQGSFFFLFKSFQFIKLLQLNNITYMSNITY